MTLKSSYAHKSGLGIKREGFKMRACNSLLLGLQLSCAPGLVVCSCSQTYSIVSLKPENVLVINPVDAHLSIFSPSTRRLAQSIFLRLPVTTPPLLLLFFSSPYLVYEISRDKLRLTLKLTQAQWNKQFSKLFHLQSREYAASAPVMLAGRHQLSSQPSVLR